MAMAQTLAPRAYVITPVNANAITLSWSYFDGGLNFNGAIPVTGATGTYHVPVLSYYHSFNLFGRSANVVGFLPYGVGTFQGEVLGSQRQIYRSGLLDIAMRFSVNLMGGPAMKMQEFAKWKQKRLLGASLIVIAPTGQYDPMHLINWGINRWAFKAELGYSQRWGHWVLDGYGGVWFYTANKAFYSVPNPQPLDETEAPPEQHSSPAGVPGKSDSGIALYRALTSPPWYLAGCTAQRFLPGLGCPTHSRLLRMSGRD